MKKIEVNEIASLKDNELIEIRLKTGRIVNGYISSTSTSHSSFTSQSNGALDYLVIKNEGSTDSGDNQNSAFERIISVSEIAQVFIKDGF